jgi:hypothetical protein
MARTAAAKHDSGVSPQPAHDVTADVGSFSDTLEPLAREGAVTLEDVLETVGEFGSASLDLVAWEFSISESELMGVWDLAVGARLLRSVGLSKGTGEQMYVLATPGR